MVNLLAGFHDTSASVHNLTARLAGKFAAGAEGHCLIFRDKKIILSAPVPRTERFRSVVSSLVLPRGKRVEAPLWTRSVKPTELEYLRIKALS